MKREVEDEEVRHAPDLYTDEQRQKVSQMVDISEPTKAEVRAKMEAINADAALGPDGVNIRAYRDGGEEVMDEIHAICGEIMRTQQWPQEFADSNMTPIPKKPGAQQEGEHRGASVSAHASKVMTGILNDRISAAVEATVGEYQFGFRRRRGTDDAVLALRMLMDRTHRSGNQLHVGFIDLVKAFDTVDWSFLFEIMRAMGFPENMIAVISSLYAQTRFRVKTRDGISEWIEQQCGVRQGCCLSSGLFILFLEHAIRLMEEGGTAGIDIAEQVIGFIGYADDLALVDLELQSFRQRMKKTAEGMKRVGMELSVPKTKALIMGRKVSDSLQCEVCGRTDGETKMLICGDSEGRYGCGKGRHATCGMPVLQQAEERANERLWGGDELWEWYCEECEATKGRIIINGKAIEEVEEFDYLGTRQQESYDCGYTILHRMAKATNCFRALRAFWRSRTNLYIKGAAYVTLVRTVLLYGAAAWVMTAEDRLMLEAWDAANCRYILNVSKRQHLRSQQCRERLNIKWTIEAEVKRARLRIFLKIARSSTPNASYACTYLDRLIFAENGQKKTSRGRPVKTWLHCLMEDLGEYNYGIYAGRSLARANATKFKQLFLD